MASDKQKSRRRLRRLAWISLGLILVYTLAGFFLAPRILRHQIVKMFDETFGLEASLEEVHINPYALTVRARGFDLRDAQGGDLVGFDELLVNLQTSSLFRWAWTFREIRLDGPRASLILQADGSVNLEALIPPPAEDAAAPPADADEEAALPRLLIQQFTLAEGRAHFEDRTRPEAFITEAGPITFSLSNLSTLPDESGDLSLHAELESGTSVTWEGTLTVQPPGSSGRLTLTDAHMPITKRYLQDTLRFHIPAGLSEATLNYSVALAGENLEFKLSDSNVRVHDFVATTRDDAEFLSLPDLQVNGIDLMWPERELSIAELAVHGLHASVWRNEEGALNILEHLVGAPEEAANGSASGDVEGASAADESLPIAGAGTGTGAGVGAPTPGEPEAESALADWRVSIETLQVADLAADFEDRTFATPLKTGLQDVRVTVRDIDNQPGSRFPVEMGATVATGGSLSFTGQLAVLPHPGVDGQVQVDALSLLPAQPVLDGVASLRLDSGFFSMGGSLVSSEEETLSFTGRVELTELVGQDTVRDEQLFGLGRLLSENTALQLDGGSLRLTSLLLERLYGRLTIYADSTTNVGNVLAVEGEAEAAPAPEAAAAEDDDPSAAALPLAIAIDEIRILDGSADFSDLSLALPFASRIDALQGTINEMASDGSSARIDLEGTVDEYGLARVEGSMDFFAPDRRSDVKVAFRNVEMNRLSPYTAEFAGYAVESGRLSLDLRYRLADRTLDSQNEILVDQLTLGEKVDSPDAPNLPVKLAVALLKDKDGRIELDIPVGGTLDDPEFAYGKLVWKALRNVMTKIATAPFRALARLIGSDKDLEFLEFAAAESEVSPPARETLDQLVQALAERPELQLEVQGVFDPGTDAAALREEKLAALLAERRAAAAPPAEGSAESTAGPSSAERTGDILAALYGEQFGEEALAELQAAHTRSAAPAATEGAESAVPEAEKAAESSGTAAPTLDLGAYMDALRAALVEAQPVSDDELVALADARAMAIRDHIAGQGLPDTRVTLKPGAPIKPKDAGSNWVRLRLVIAAGKGGGGEAGPPESEEG